MLVRTVWPSKLASSSMMRLACALEFYSIAAAYSIASVNMLYVVVVVAPHWGISRVWGWGASRKTALFSKLFFDFLHSIFRLYLLNCHVKWGGVAPQDVSDVSYQSSRNLAFNRPHAHIWAAKLFTLLSLVILTQQSFHSTWRLSS